MTKLKCFIKILTPLLIISVILENVSCYSRISFNGFNSTNDEGPKIYKVTNLDLLFPQKNNPDNASETTTTIPAQTSPAQQISTSSSSWSSFQQPTIFITPVSEDIIIKTTMTTRTTPKTLEIISATKKPLIIAETYELTEKFPDQFQANRGFEGEILPPTGVRLTKDEQVDKQQEKMLQPQQLNSQRTPEKQPGLSHKMPQKQSQLLHTLKLPQQQHLHNRFFTSTGRAANSQFHYPFGQFVTSLPTNAKLPIFRGHRYHHNHKYHHQQRPISRPTTSLPGKFVYPANRYRARYPSQRRHPSKTAKDKTIDRFSPSEAVVSHHLKNQNLQYKPASSNNIKASAFSSPDQISSYTPPKELYSFPPNINSKYPMPPEDAKATVPASSITSYLPPPSGPLPSSDAYQNMQTSNDGNTPTNGGGYVYSGPVNPSYVPSSNMTEGSEESKEPNNDDGQDSGQSNDENNVGVLPANAMDSSNSDTANTSGMDSHNDNTYDHNSHDHDHPLEDIESDKEYPTPPPGWLEENPKEIADNKPSQALPPPKLTNINHYDDADYHHHLHNLPTFPIYPYHKPYPELIYDDFHHHHHHHDHPHIHQPEPEIKTTTPPPPEPRVKKYSYFYIGRKLWYIPLYFTVWFSFYVLWLIVKSIARHKVNLPNHYVSRRSLPWDSLNHNSNEEYIDELTTTFLKSIERFRKAYLS